MERNRTQSQKEKMPLRSRIANVAGKLVTYGLIMPAIKLEELRPASPAPPAPRQPSEKYQAKREATRVRGEQKLHQAYEDLRAHEEFEPVLRSALREDNKPGRHGSIKLPKVSVKALRQQDPDEFRREAMAFIDYKDHIAAGLVDNGSSEKDAQAGVQKMIYEDPKGMIEAAFEWDVARQNPEEQQLNHVAQ